jgi:hypothetical protein
LVWATFWANFSQTNLVTLAQHDSIVRLKPVTASLQKKRDFFPATCFVFGSGLPDGVLSDQKICVSGSASQWKMLVFFMDIIDRLNGYWVYFVVIWYIFPGVGILCKEKSGNPVSDTSFSAKNVDTKNSGHGCSGAKLSSIKGASHEKYSDQKKNFCDFFVFCFFVSFQLSAKKPRST